MKFKNNLDNSKIDAELVKTFNSNGFPLTKKYSTLAISYVYNPYNRWFINKEVDTPEYTVWEIKYELKVYIGYNEYKFVKIRGRYYEIQLAVT